MRTYERVFLHVRPFCREQENGHALRNIENKKTLASAKEEIEKMLQATSSTVKTFKG